MSAETALNLLKWALEAALPFIPEGALRPHLTAGVRMVDDAIADLALAAKFRATVPDVPADGGTGGP
jgi:hypothetical protein